MVVAHTLIEAGNSVPAHVTIAHDEILAVQMRDAEWMRPSHDRLATDVHITLRHNSTVGLTMWADEAQRFHDDWTSALLQHALS